MQGRVVSICISEQRGVLKNEVVSVEITNHGIVGDGHSGDWERQVTCLNYQSFEKAKEKHPELDLRPGSFAENITIEGIDFTKIEPGSKLQLGDSIVLQVSQIGKEDHPSVVTRTYGISLLPYEGLFCKVIVGGTLSKGDKVEII
ncbi:MAG: MOSC domain-containing protein [Firmicutes bacterium HGW-Firmicutes-20]|jgi:MOSC domain-containing protein YiiM|nr:MAG: MOSC domain-containing protein [Firmicutes bacterium HGW-Firmicutes-20]PKM69719.1 MAG: MOSC domain-containing protein [Firmicutes bacterium HGW-Firmicutes-19]